MNGLACVADDEIDLFFQGFVHFGGDEGDLIGGEGWKVWNFRNFNFGGRGLNDRRDRIVRGLAKREEEGCNGQTGRGDDAEAADE